MFMLGFVLATQVVFSDERGYDRSRDLRCDIHGQVNDWIPRVLVSS
jgi:hypothetical protein